MQSALRRQPSGLRYSYDIQLGILHSLGVVTQKNKGWRSMQRGRLNRLVRRANGCAKRVEMLANLLALVFGIR